MAGFETVEQREKRHFERFMASLPEMMEQASQLDHDLNFFGDYIGSEKLFEAKRHATAIYYILKKFEK